MLSSCKPLQVTTYHVTRATRSPFRSTYTVQRGDSTWQYLSKMEAEGIIFYGRLPKDKK